MLTGETARTRFLSAEGLASTHRSELDASREVRGHLKARAEATGHDDRDGINDAPALAAAPM